MIAVRLPFVLVDRLILATFRRLLLVQILHAQESSRTEDRQDTMNADGGSDLTEDRQDTMNVDVSSGSGHAAGTEAGRTSRFCKVGVLRCLFGSR